MGPSSPSGAPRSPALFFGREEELARYAAEMPRVRLSVVYGAGGVGKTAFALRASEDLAARLGAPRGWARCRPGESAATLAAAAADSIAAAAGSPLDALIGAGPLVLVIDDAQLADPLMVTELCAYLVSRSAGIHLCVTSRTVLPFSPVDIDHLIIKLAGLDDSTSAALWSALESLYGSRPRAAVAGNPLLIKRAFAEGEPAGDSLGLGDLAPLARQVLVELCALRRPAPRATLAEGRDGPAVDQALRALEARFLVEAARDGFGVHELIREAVDRSAWRPGVEAHARWIARFRADAATGDESALIELLHHAVAAGEDSLAVELLRPEADLLRRIPPGSTLLDRAVRTAIDQLEQRIDLPVELRLLRARVRARQGEVRAAFDELESLAEDSPALACDRAEVALMLGMIDRARAAALRVLDDPTASPIAHARSLAIAVDATRTAGDVPGALELADRETAPLRQLGPLREGLRAWLRAVTFTDGELYAEAVSEIARARSLLLPSFPSAMPMLSSLERTAAVLAGTASPPEEDAGELFDENAMFRCLARLLRAQELLARGQFRRAADLAETTWQRGAEMELLQVVSWAGWLWSEAACALGEHAAVIARATPLLSALESAGHLPPRVRLSVALAEALEATGDRAAALALADRARELAARFPRTRARANALAARAGARALAAPGDDLTGFGAAENDLASAGLAVERGDLPAAGAAAAEVERNAARFGWAGLERRAALFASEVSLRSGDLLSARRRLAEHGAEMDDRTARLHAAALTAALARAEGRPVPVADAGAIGERLHLGEPAVLELVSDRGRMLLSRSQLDEIALPTGWVVDRERGFVRRAGETIDLSRRATLLELAAALACPPGAWLTPAELAERAWQLDYHPLKHHSRLAMAVARLREAIGVDAIEGGRAGYRLVETPHWAVIQPLREQPAG